MDNLENKTICVIAHDNPIGYAIVDDDNTIPCDKIVTYEGKESLHLPSNNTLRVWIDRAEVDAAIADHGYLGLDYKSRRQQGTSVKMFKVVSYLTEEELSEISSIVIAARERMQADKRLTDFEKIQARLDRLNVKIKAMTTNRSIDISKDASNDTTTNFVRRNNTMTEVKKSIFDYMTDTEYARYNELITKASELKANAPKVPSKPHEPPTTEAKLKAEGRRDALRAKIQALISASVLKK